MNKQLKSKIETFVKQNIGDFHQRRLESITKLVLKPVLCNKNPYLFRAKDLDSAADLITALVEARLSSSEEGSFGGFLEELAIYVAEQTGGGKKSGIKGIDIELTRGGTRYLIAVKSGRKWGNTQSRREQKQNFKDAVRTIKQSRQAGELQPVLGIGYGRFKTKHYGDFLEIGGQSFWHLLSGDEEFYVDVIEPIGFQAKENAIRFAEQKTNTLNRLTREFTNEFCNKDGSIDWRKLVTFVSQNMKG